MFYFPLSTVAVLVGAGLLASTMLLGLLLWLHRSGNRAGIRRVLGVAVPLWFLGLLVAVLPAAPFPDPSIPDGTFNWVPFLAHAERDLGVELAANLGLFMPLGLMLAFYWRSFSVAKSTVAALVLSVCIELAQLLLHNNRASDITDIMANTAGGFLAAALGWALCRRFPPRTGAGKTIAGIPGSNLP